MSRRLVRLLIVLSALYGLTLSSSDSALAATYTYDTGSPASAGAHGASTRATLTGSQSLMAATASAAISPSAAVAGVAAEAGAGRAVIGKVDDLTPAGAIGPGERTLLDQLPDLGSPRANWGQNSGVLRKEMGRGLPIRDASVDPATGALINNTGFLRAERYLLQDRGWSFDPKTTQWLPPGW